jgi:protein-S-isoprenylcysteine O-methyltransferase Ste14
MNNRIANHPATMARNQTNEKPHLPPWVTPLILAALFLLVHVALPWGISSLSTRHEWEGRRPGRWNRLALVPAGSAIAGTLYLIVQHYRASPRTFLDLQPGHKLITPGPYGVSRNPMYLLELTFWLGWALFYGSFAVLAVALLWFVTFNFFIIPYEEHDLERRFGEAYLRYKQTVPRWLAFPLNSTSRDG